MEIFDNNPLDTFPSTESKHPVLTAMNEKFASLQNDYRLLQTRFTEYGNKLESILVEGIDAYDEDTIRYVADAMGLSLSTTKEIEVNVTFTLTLEVPLGEEIDPEWDIEFEPKHEYIIDYNSDVIYSKEA